MPELCSHRDAQACGGAIRSGCLRSGCVRNPLCLLLALLILVRSGESPAGEQASIAVAPPRPDFNLGSVAGHEPRAVSAPQFDLPKAYVTPDAVMNDRLHPGDFRPRGPSVVEHGSPVAAADDLPMLHGTSVWERLADYRSHGRVRLLTLWETGGSSVSLQAGRKGEPSLQWTSHSMNRNGAPRGLFDQLLPGVIRSSHPANRQNSSDPFQRPSKTPESAISSTK
jgi:hypothetical protein